MTDAVAFVFPGQGSQIVGMGKDLYDHFPEAKAVFDAADEALGFKISALCFEGPEPDLNLTCNTQPAVVTVSIAALRALETRVDLRPDYVAGHSLGEYSALIAAKAMSFADGVRTVRLRGQFMQEAVPAGKGGMAAVLGLDKEGVADLCREAAQGEVLVPANFNAPGQVVISGHAPAIERALSLGKAKGAKRIVSLPVSAPFHCSLMVPAGEKLKASLEMVTISPICCPVVTNVEARENSDAGRVKALLVEQMSHPVLWEDSVIEMVARGVRTFVEIGPGKVLSGLVKRIDKSIQTFNVEDVQSLEALVNAWKGID